MKNMKKIQRYLFGGLAALIVSMSLVSCYQYKVYSVKDAPVFPINGGAVYSLPKTLLRVDVTLQRRDLSGAIYKDYAADYLGVTDVDSLYHIADIDVTAVNVADVDNSYYVRIRRGGGVTIDSRHLLVAVGMQGENASLSHDAVTPSVPVGTSQPRAEYNLYDRMDTFYTRNDTPGNPSLVTTRKDVKSLARRASDEAERIEALQTKKQELIGGEYAGSYSTDAIQYLYSQLTAQEQQSVKLFCGTMKSEKISFYIDPRFDKKGMMNDTVVWFSPTMGFVGDSLSDDATPLVCVAESMNTLRTVKRFVKYHISGMSGNGSSGRTGAAAERSRERKCFRYRIPEKVSVSVLTPDDQVKRTLQVSQLGAVVPLPRRIVRATFDPETLDLIYLGD